VRSTFLDGAAVRSWVAARAIWWGWRAEFSGAAEYRVDLVSGTLVSTLWLGIAVAPMLVVSTHAQVAQGWTLPRLLFLSAIWYLLDAVLWMVIVTNHRRLEHEITHGTLDVVLLRPVNSLLLCTLGTIYVQDTPKAVLALALGAGAIVVGGGPPSVLAAVATAVAVVCACVLLWAAGVLVTYKALTHVRFDATFAIGAVHNLARVPTPLYGPVLHLVMTVVVPVTFLTTVPAQLFYGTASLWWAPASVALTVVTVAVASRLWHGELRRYTGSMG
jgi:ABC-2 type transport system permease protein